jgi:hypothetical protein
MRVLIIILFIFSSVNSGENDLLLLPINSETRQNIGEMKLTQIGQFSKLRKERTSVPAHYHTGIDIKRPKENYEMEPIFPITKGLVVSKRDDGPFAQIIIEHRKSNILFWTVYEHIAGIQVEVGNEVNPYMPIARFMNKQELNRYGWQFDHFHFEVLKIKPIELFPDSEHLDRFYGSYTLICYSISDLEKYFYNPISFFEKYLRDD